MSDPKVGDAAKNLFKDAKDMLENIDEKKVIEVKAVVGFWACNQINNNDIEIYDTKSKKKVLTTLNFLRQQKEQGLKRPNRCLADFIIPKEATEYFTTNGRSFSKYISILLHKFVHLIK